jgi:hypothetical protein
MHCKYPLDLFRNNEFHLVKLVDHRKDLLGPNHTRGL